MFVERLARLINHRWPWILGAWIVATIALRLIAPSWSEIAKDGDLDYLPPQVASLQGKQLLESAFPDNKTHSQAVIVLSRGGAPLEADDRRYGLELAEEVRSLKDLPKEEGGLPIVDVWDQTTAVVGDMLLAEEGKAAMVVTRLTSGLMDVDNARVLHVFQTLVERTEEKRPEGLEVSLTGSALIGGDLRASIEESLASTELTTVLLVLGCLILIYRAPFLVLIPLATIGVSMSVSYDVVALLADNFGPDDYAWSDFKIFTTTKIFVVVILFGAGTDYCLFLIARFKEELAGGVDRSEAPGRALANVGDALAGSAFTTILGLSTMAFAQYGKFISSGPIVAVCLFIAMLSCVTFAPALLRALGPSVFWPLGQKKLEAAQNSDGDADEPSDAKLWNWVSDMVMRRPGTILAVSAWLSVPLIIIGTQVGVTHDFMADLAPDRTSVVGANVIREYYSQGVIAPMTVVAQLPEASEADLTGPDSRYVIEPLHIALYEQAPSVADVRSLYRPIGGPPGRQSFLGGGGIKNLAVSGSPLSNEAFVSSVGEHAGRVTQLAVVLEENPFTKTARDKIPEIQEWLADFAAQEQVNDEPNPWYGARFEVAGVTPGMRDLEVVTNSDRTRIQVLTVAAVYLVLLFILRRPIEGAYLIVTVLLSYGVTLGATSIFFDWCYGDTFRGLDWKVPVFLFVILVAVGQDYNIYLATRVFEEQKKLGLKKGLRRAIVQTGGIITSCGVIMAGTFISMATGTLRGMIELGFALALGVILDTFFVRTVVVPCFFALLARREKEEDEPEPPQAQSSSPKTITDPSHTPAGLAS